MTFEWPLLLSSLLLVPLALLGYLLLQRRRTRYAVRFTNLDLLASVVERTPGWRRHIPPALALAALAALLTGTARPQATISVPREEATVVLAIDTSASMTATDVQPNRLEAARGAAETFLEEVPERFRVGVVAFSSEAHVAAPPTDDRAVVREALASLEAEAGTAIGEAIDRSLAVGQEAIAGEASAGSSGGEESSSDEPLSVLLLSDGANTTGIDPEEAAERARELGVPVFTVALGTDEGAVIARDQNGVLRRLHVPPEPETLARIAERTGAEFFAAPGEAELNRVYEEIGSRVGFVEEEQEVTFLFAAAGALLLLAGAGLSAFWFNRIP